MLTNSDTNINQEQLYNAYLATLPSVHRSSSSDSGSQEDDRAEDPIEIAVEQ